MATSNMPKQPATPTGGEVPGQQLVWVIKNCDLEGLKELIAKGNFNINTKIEGRYPIHYAADYGHAEILEYLLVLGAKVNAVDSYGITPLLAAIWEGHTEVVKILLSNGADPDGRTPQGLTYLEASDKPEILEILKQHV